jgi:hypothetical protein
MSRIKWEKDLEVVYQILGLKYCKPAVDYWSTVLINEVCTVLYMWEYSSRSEKSLLKILLILEVLLLVVGNTSTSTVIF